MKYLKCPICGKRVTVDVIKGKVTMYDGDYWHGEYHKCSLKHKKKGDL